MLRVKFKEYDLGFQLALIAKCTNCLHTKQEFYIEKIITLKKDFWVKKNGKVVLEKIITVRGRNEAKILLGQMAEELFQKHLLEHPECRTS